MTEDYNVCVSHTCSHIALWERKEEQRCNEKCYNGGTFNGTCECKTGWIGTCCESQCNEGYYGTGCKQECRCPENTKCDKENGACLRVQNAPKSVPTRTYIIIGVAAVGFILIQLLAVLLFLKFRQKKRKIDDTTGTIKLDKFWSVENKAVKSTSDTPESHYDEIPCADTQPREDKTKKSVKIGSKRKKEKVGSIYQGLDTENNDDGYQTLKEKRGGPVQPTVYMTPHHGNDPEDPMDIITSLANPRYLSMSGDNTRLENQYVSMYNTSQTE